MVAQGAANALDAFQSAMNNSPNKGSPIKGPSFGACVGGGPAAGAGGFGTGTMSAHQAIAQYND